MVPYPRDVGDIAARLRAGEEGTRHSIEEVRLVGGIDHPERAYIQKRHTQSTVSLGVISISCMTSRRRA